MTAKLQITVAFVAGVALAGTAAIVALYPTDYNECVLKTMPSVTTDDAAVFILQACRDKFPLDVQGTARTARPLAPEETFALTGRAGPQSVSSNTYSGNLYNGNDQLTVTEVDFLVIAVLRGDSTTRRYRVPLLIEPLRTEPFSFDFIRGGPGSDYSWLIVGGRGYNRQIL